MGGSSPVRKIKKAVKQVVGSAESAVQFAVNPAAEATSKAFTAVTGKKAGAIFNPTGEVAGEAAEKFIDQPKALKKEAAAESARLAEAQSALNSAKKRKDQAGAEDTAAEDLRRRRAVQSKGRQQGRRSTILTDSLGSVGEPVQRKSLLGL